MIHDTTTRTCLLVTTTLASIAICGFGASCTTNRTGREPSMPDAPTASNEVVLVSDVRWEQLNPARGDASPRAGTLWGDRKGTVPTGYLIRFEDGFSSPPHIHNVSYRGVVIRGLVHNDDPAAAPMWMPPGSFWTQPKGEVHITAAKGSDNLAYIEIDEGPYLVLPTVRAFDSGERPVNVDAANLVWLDASVLTDGVKHSAGLDHPEVAFLWGTPSRDELHGALVRLPSGFDGEIVARGSSFRAVVVAGQPRYGDDDTPSRVLDPGSYFASSGPATHRVRSSAGRESVVYVRTNGGFEVVQTAPAK